MKLSEIKAHLLQIQFTKAHLHDRACEFDAYVDKHNLPFYSPELIGRNYVLYRTTNGSNLLVKITENINCPLTIDGVKMHHEYHST